ncbi:MAG: hypothetical protein P8Y44_00125 [Acidobacteriota bacterium]
MREDQSSALEIACGLMSRSEVSVVGLTGQDRSRYLNGLVTCRVDQLPTGEGVYGFFTDNKGRILADVVVRAVESHLWLEIPAETEGTIRQHVGKFIVADRVEVEPSSDLAGLTVIGRECRELIDSSFGLSDRLESAWSHTEIELAGETSRLCREERLGLPARTFWLPRSKMGIARAHLLDLLAPAGGIVSEATAEAARIRAGVARFGKDFGTENLPQETAVEGAVSFDKGCYLGQEVVARLHYRGQVARALRSIRFATPDPRPEGTALAFEGRQAGFVTSSVAGSPPNPAQGIAMIQRRAFAVGTRLSDDLGAEVEVTSS